MLKNKLQILKLQTERDNRINDLLDQIMEVDLENEFTISIRRAVAHQDAGRLDSKQIITLAESYLDLLEKLQDVNQVDLSIARLQLEEK